MNNILARLQTASRDDEALVGIVDKQAAEVRARPEPY